MRPITVLAAALALLVAAPTASAQAKEDWPADVQKVYDDYRRDGVIDVCDHSKATLEDTRDTIKAEYDRDYPDFREAITAGIERHDSGDCSDAEASPTATAEPTETAVPDDSTAGGGTTGSGGDDGVSTDGFTEGAEAESGALPQDDAGAAADPGAVPPEDQIPPQATAAPPPVATVPPAAAAVAATPAIVRTGHRSLTIPLVLIGIALLGGLALALSAFAARRSPRLQHAWQEAAFRTRGTWADFSDWLRLGR